MENRQPNNPQPHESQAIETLHWKCPYCVAAAKDHHLTEELLTGDIRCSCGHEWRDADQLLQEYAVALQAAVQFDQVVREIGTCKALTEILVLEATQKIYEEIKDSDYFLLVSRLSSIRQSVIMSMWADLGFAKISLFSRMWAALKAKDYAEAAKEMLDSTWAAQVGSRATELAYAMSNGEWPQSQ